MHLISQNTFMHFDLSLNNDRARTLFSDRKVRRALFHAIETEKGRTRYVIVEGVFLFKRPLPQILDFKVFLEAEPSVARHRFKQRRVEVRDERPVEVFDQIWLPAFERYCNEENPREAADLIVAGQ